LNNKRRDFKLKRDNEQVRRQRQTQKDEIQTLIHLSVEEWGCQGKGKVMAWPD
jgi:hypothetical protein